MVAQLLLRAIGIAIGDRCHDGRVVTQDLADLALDRKMQPADAVDVNALPAHQRPQFGNAGGHIDMPVKRQIGIVEAFKVAGFRLTSLLGDGVA